MIWICMHLPILSLLLTADEGQGSQLIDARNMDTLMASGM